MADIIVIGGGTAGLTAALYARRAGKSVTLFEKESTGGQIVYSPRIENYPGTAGVRTFTDRELRQLFSAAGFTKSEFYYPYPDYKFPQAIYTDAYLPRPGTLSNSHTNFDQERFVTFDEQKAYDTVISNDMFPFFSNSYLVLIH